MKKLYTLILVAATFLMTTQHASAQCGLALFQYSPNPASNSIQFFDSSFFANGFATSWSWSFGDGTASNQQHPTHTYNSSGVYVVCLTATATNPQCTVTYCDSIVVNNSTNCMSAFTYTGAGSSLSVSFTDQSSGGITSWLWDFGDGNTSTAQFPTYTYAAPGTYNVCLSVSNGLLGCTAMWCQPVTVGNSTNCSAQFTYTVVQSLVTFANNSTISPPATFFWSFGDGGTSTLANPSHVYTPGTYTACLVVNNSNGCSDTMCQTIVVSGGGTGTCQAAFTAIPDSSGFGFTFQNQSTGTFTASQWSFGDGTGSSQLSPTHSYNSTGTYTVCLTVTDSATNCSSTTCTTVTTGTTPPCVANFTFTVDTTGYLFTFNNTSTGSFSTAIWNFGDGTPSSSINPVAHQYNTPGTYNVCLSIYGQPTLCSDTYCVTITVPGNNPCVPVFYTYPDSSAVGNGVTNFVVTSSCGTTTYTWSFGDGSSGSTLQNPIHQYGVTGWYYVCVTATYANGLAYTFCDSVYALRLQTNILNSEGNAFAEFTNYPNPFSDHTTISFVSAEPTEITLRVLDLEGREISMIHSGSTQAGKNIYTWNSENIAGGIYILQVTAPQGMATRRISLIK